MKETLTAVFGLGLLAGGCSLTSPGGLATTGALHASASPVVISSEAPQGLGPVIEDKPDRPLAATRRGGGVEPVAALDASARARTKWETLRPGDLTSTPVASGRAAPETTSTLAAAPTARTRGDNYDRDAAMQGLINGGKNAGKAICSGC
jgi:hypothetical protein